MNPIFNSSDFVTVSTSGFTEAQADAKYLQLATPSTCTAVETFASGIETNAISAFEGNICRSVLEIAV